ncbi:MAG TPA: myo-inosose-2 dehydratase [Burkholderiaceae bacterium]|nr:myo-inosose-2 dehydratase [Burkholderiaceae bacterium]
MAHPFDVKIGINPISWSNDDLPSLGGETSLETALTEGKAIGYRGFELGNKFPRDPETLRRLMAGYGLEVISGWYSGRLVHRSAAEEIDAVQPHLKLLTANNCRVMVYGEVADSVQGEPVPIYKRPQFRSDAAWRTYAERVTVFARYLLAQGIRLAYHHHMGAYVEAPADIDHLMHLTGPEVGLLFDSGHATFAGGDAVAVLARHVERVCHVHCKDVRPDVLKLARNRNWSFLQSVINGAFTVPGDGAVDFPALLKILHEARYSGWLVVEAEQDPAVAPSFAYAQKGYQHLARLVRNVAGSWQEAA